MSLKYWFLMRYAEDVCTLHMAGSYWFNWYYDTFWVFAAWPLISKNWFTLSWIVNKSRSIRRHREYRIYNNSNVHTACVRNATLIGIVCTIFQLIFGPLWKRNWFITIYWYQFFSCQFIVVIGFFYSSKIAFSGQCHSNRFNYTRYMWPC